MLPAGRQSIGNEGPAAKLDLAGALKPVRTLQIIRYIYRFMEEGDFK
jgi:hypothetical protein